MTEINTTQLNAYPEHLIRAALPESMRDFMRIIPLDAVLKIVEAHGGTRIYIPVYPQPDEGLGKLIGMENAKALKSFAGCQIEIPVMDKVHIMARRAGVLDSLARGASLRDTARAFGMTARNVSYIRSLYGK